MPLPVSLKFCRSHLSPAIRSSLCRSTPPPQRTGRDPAHSEFLRDRLKKNSKQCSSIAKLKRKRRSYQVEAEKTSLPSSRRASCLRYACQFLRALIMFCPNLLRFTRPCSAHELFEVTKFDRECRFV